MEMFVVAVVFADAAAFVVLIDVDLDAMMLVEPLLLLLLSSTVMDMVVSVGSVMVSCDD